MNKPITNFSVGLKAMIINKDHKVLISKRSNKVAKAGFYDLPGGRMILGETLRTGLAREIYEEVGLKLEKVFAPLAITTFIRDVDQSNQIVRIIFPCYTSGDVKTDGDEVCDFLWINPEDCKQYQFADEDFISAFERIKDINFSSEDYLGLGALNDSLKILK
jgi:ADP-ribose pyrophosphatase YjhB (NUDIX family)